VEEVVLVAEAVQEEGIVMEYKIKTLQKFGAKEV